eukprot:84196-Chlamydomonas_euryale.AAC.1
MAAAQLQAARDWHVRADGARPRHICAWPRDHRDVRRGDAGVRGAQPDAHVDQVVAGRHGQDVDARSRDGAAAARPGHPQVRGWLLVAGCCCAWACLDTICSAWAQSAVHGQAWTRPAAHGHDLPSSGGCLRMLARFHVWPGMNVLDNA